MVFWNILFQIKHLVNENPNHKDSDPPDNISIATIEAAMNATKNISNNNNNIPQSDRPKQPTGFKPLFFKPYLGMCIIVNVLNFFILLG